MVAHDRDNVIPVLSLTFYVLSLVGQPKHLAYQSKFSNITTGSQLGPFPGDKKPLLTLASGLTLQFGGEMGTIHPIHEFTT